MKYIECTILHEASGEISFINSKQERIASTDGSYYKIPKHFLDKIHRVNNPIYILIDKQGYLIVNENFEVFILEEIDITYEFSPNELKDLINLLCDDNWEEDEIKDFLSKNYSANLKR